MNKYFNKIIHLFYRNEKNASIRSDVNKAVKSPLRSEVRLQGTILSFELIYISVTQTIERTFIRYDLTIDFDFSFILIEQLLL